MHEVGDPAAMGTNVVDGLAVTHTTKTYELCESTTLRLGRFDEADAATSVRVILHKDLDHLDHLFNYTSKNGAKQHP